ncbi:MAG: DUF2817 domain-containing protein [Flavobacteriales bacterium]|nr:DUF2817 domain-containing protein [Flavobacteriales bacterium]
MIEPILNDLKSFFKISSLGKSEMEKDIHSITIGNGNTKILVWSQMHGNESTTTKALFDILNYLTSESEFQQDVLEKYTIIIIPILNPDGAALYTRENANGVDLNRDALELTQKESIILRNIFEDFKPDYCLNLHDQRTIYNVGNTNLPATISFLAPAADVEKTITSARKKAMSLIVGMQEELEKFIPGQIGRYDDSFNLNCVGDFFQSKGIPTILFEAGHFQQDYQREKTRSFIALALYTFLNSLLDKSLNNIYKNYFNIPENSTSLRDIALKNAKIKGQEKLVNVYIQFKEELQNNKIEFILVIDSIKEDFKFFGHREIDVKMEKITHDCGNLFNEGQVIKKLYFGKKKLHIK